MKPSLQLKLSQHLTLTPQLQQSIRLLQLSTLELNQELERFLQENPLLEREEEGDEHGGAENPDQQGAPASDEAPRGEGEREGDGAGNEAPEYDTASSSATTSSNQEEFDEASSPEMPEVPDVGSEPAREALDDADWVDEGSYSGSGGSAESDDNDFPQVASGGPSLREHLLWQLNITPLSVRDKQLAAIVIDSLDDDGYFKQDVNELVGLMPPEAEVDVDDIQIALRHVQQMEPTGVGARTLSECLQLQIESLPPDVPHREEALTIVKNHLDALAARDYAKLKKVLRCEDDTLRAVQKLITGLNPRPGLSFSKDDARYVVADVIVKKIKGAWVASLNPDAMPKLKINRMYADILSRNRDASFQQLSGQLQEAKWLIKNVQQRFDTILRVSQCIVDRQRHFFEHGEVAMRPLVLREIAELLGLHESTVSRVTTQKYMLTPRGIFELKYFFGSHVATETGGACSATAIRALIKQLVGEEDSKRPLSDSQISEILGKQGIVVARRTIAKYRESLQILPVNLRKTL
ncbi:MAG: RNA polymerase factor sigma-54 [Betaproteobacteria bacterium]|nr:RNA polymerase factor sigma-54 [Betaproteobacteria bacterium]